MRVSLALVVVTTVIIGCDMPTAPVASRLAPEAGASHAARGPAPMMAGSGTIPDSEIKGGGTTTTTITLNARNGAGTDATGRFRIRTPTETWTGSLTCLRVRNGTATATGTRDDGGPVNGSARVTISIRDGSASGDPAGDAAGYARGVQEKGCSSAIPMHPVIHGSFIVRGHTTAGEQPKG